MTTVTLAALCRRPAGSLRGSGSAGAAVPQASGRLTRLRALTGAAQDRWPVSGLMHRLTFELDELGRPPAGLGPQFNWPVCRLDRTHPGANLRLSRSVLKMRNNF